MMTNEELQHAIEDARRMVRSTSPNEPIMLDLVAHLRALLLEQHRRATVRTPVTFTPSYPYCNTR